MKQEISNRVESLRKAMQKQCLDAYIIPSTDPHNGEYVPSHWQARQWISGFCGSAGTAVVTTSRAALWTDSRYFIAAAQCLEQTPFALMKERTEGTPSIAQWLANTLPAGSVVGIDGWVNSRSDVASLRNELESLGLQLRCDCDVVSEVWDDRPPLPRNKITIQPIAYAGETAKSKLQRIRRTMASHECDAMLATELDEVAWTLNLRGSDVHCNPVFVAYLLITPTTATLFIDAHKLSAAVTAHLAAAEVATKPYDDVLAAASALSGKHVWLLPATNERLSAALSRGNKCRVAPSPIAEMKAVKNEVEIRGFRNAMVRDGVAMVKFLRWLIPAVKAGGQTEMSIDRKLTALRAEQPLFRDISFDTIAAYCEHGAIVHYEATPQTDATLRPEGLLLLDSGAQYQDGTTDITRTIALGNVSDDEKRAYTLVLKGHIALSRCRFPEGASGTQLDLAARYAMWQCALNFGHGTGHGVGSYLNVHEGPHQIRMNYVPAPIKAGMTVTDEPGLYFEGRFGVRIENTLLAVPFRESEFGKFVQFEPLTLCPIDTTPIDWSQMRPDEMEWLNDYHATVRRRLLPALDDEADRRWLIEKTAARRADGSTR